MTRASIMPRYRLTAIAYATFACRPLTLLRDGVRGKNAR